jgi:hypothetical protein
LIKSTDVIWYLTREIEGLKETDLTCTINEGEVTLYPVHWLDDTWGNIMDLVYCFDGEWVKDGKNSHWIFDVEVIDYRIAEERWIEENRPLMEWWIQQPDDVKTELIPLYGDKDKWRKLPREEKAKMIRVVRALLP